MKEMYCSRLKKLFYHPKMFFRDVEKEKGYSGIMFFYVVIAAFALVFKFVLSVVVGIYTLQGAALFTGIVQFFLALVFGIGIAFAVPYIVSGVAHLGVLIFRGKQGYFNTYKPVVYSSSVSQIYAAIVAFAGIIFTLLFFKGAFDIQNIVWNAQSIVYVSLIVSIEVISFIHVLCIQVIGISKYQKMSKLRAFFSSIIIPLILIIIISVILIVYASYFLAI